MLNLAVPGAIRGGPDPAVTASASSHPSGEQQSAQFQLERLQSMPAASPVFRESWDQRPVAQMLISTFLVVFFALKLDDLNAL
jgi:hypothetical protein